MNCTNKIVGALLLGMGVVGSAVADNGVYAGLSAGRMSYDVCGELRALVAASCDDEDTAWKVFGGYQFTENFALEGGWADLGEVSASAAGTTASAEVDGFVVSAKGMLPITEQFGVFGKVGFFMWEVEGGGAAAGIDDDGTDLAYGIGAQYMFTEQFGVVGEWERFDSDDEADLLSVGLMMKF